MLVTGVQRGQSLLPLTCKGQNWYLCGIKVNRPHLLYILKCSKIRMNCPLYATKTFLPPLASQTGWVSVKQSGSAEGEAANHGRALRGTIGFLQDGLSSVN